MTNRRGLILVVFVAILLLLLMARLKGSATTIVNNAAPDETIKVDAPISQYYVPPLLPGQTGAFDWMNQTSDLGCGCDIGQWKEPVVIQVVDQQITSYPAYNYITVNAYQPGTQIDPNSFPVYVPPPLPTWHYETGYNVHNEAVRYPVTQDGFVALLGKYNVQGNYAQQSKDATLSGTNLYYAGKRYTYDASQNRVGFVLPPQPSYYSHA